jgi:nucleotide-binding universal stress UspA family protein
MRKVLVGHDGSPASAAATSLAAELARAYGARMVMFRAVPPVVFPAEIPPAMLSETTRQLLQSARTELEALAGRLRTGAGAVDVEILVLESEPAGAIARLAAEDAEVGLVAIGTTGKTRAERFLLGSVAYRLVHLCSRPLLVSPAPPGAGPDVAPEEIARPRPLRRILVPVDFSEASRLALEQALQLGERTGAKVEILHVWEPPKYLSPDVMLSVPGWSAYSVEEMGRKDAAASLERFLEQSGWRELAAPRRLETGAPADSILRVAREGFDLIVMGTHRRTLLKRLTLGSVAHRVVSHAHECPVLTVPGPDRAVEPQ